jgi:CRISPR-associated protein Csd2
MISKQHDQKPRNVTTNMSQSTEPKTNHGIPRACGLLVIEVENSNPNGDPDRDSDPRQRPDGLGEISPVSFKRKPRDIVDTKPSEWDELKKQVKEYLNLAPLDDADFQILERRGRDRETIELEVYSGKFIEKYWDARVFGNTFLEKGDDIKKRLAKRDPALAKDDKKLKEEAVKLEKQMRRNIKAGVVQFGMGLSIKPINIRRNSQTNKSGVEEGTEQGFAPLGYRFVPRATYTMPFFVNPAGAVVRDADGQAKVVCWKRDVELLLRLIPQAYPLNPSSIRPIVRVVLAHYLEHDNLLGSFPDLEVLRKLTPAAKQAKDPDVAELPYPPSYEAWADSDAKSFLRTHLMSNGSPRFARYRELVSGIEITPDQLK